MTDGLQICIEKYLKVNSGLSNGAWLSTYAEVKYLRFVGLHPQFAESYKTLGAGFFLHQVKVNHEVNHGILACDWSIAGLTYWLTLTWCRNDRL